MQVWLLIEPLLAPLGRHRDGNGIDVMVLLTTINTPLRRSSKSATFRDTWMVRWLPLVVFPVLLVATIPASAPRWVLMWFLAGVIYIGCKWLSWHATPKPLSAWPR